MQTESLKKNYEFSKVYRRGQKNFGKYLSIYSIKSKRQRLGITVSKKAYKSSVKRNRLKRLVKECYKAFESDIKKTEVVFVIRKTEDFPNYHDLHKEMKYLFKKTKLFNEEKDV
ncbi:MAG: ribonuclease P protein component [Clostridiales bacterium]|nr:ribonuclease P protein component [Clostridiales bacterium]